MTNEAPREPSSYRASGGPGPNQPTGGHPVAAVVGGIGLLWLVLWIMIPNPKEQPIDPKTGVTKSTPGMTAGIPSAPHVTSRTIAVLPEYNAVAVLVPPDTTDDQVGQLLERFKKARRDETLVQYIPPTSKGDKLGPHAIADIYVFSDTEWATQDALRTIARGPHAAQEAQKNGPTFQELLGRIRGHYVINLHDAERRDRGSLGYADEDSGTHGPNYQELF